jgi:hypothetical protein
MLQKSSGSQLHESQHTISFCCYFDWDKEVKAILAAQAGEEVASRVSLTRVTGQSWDTSGRTCHADLTTAKTSAPSPLARPERYFQVRIRPKFAPSRPHTVRRNCY